MPVTLICSSVASAVRRGASALGDRSGDVIAVQRLWTTVESEAETTGWLLTTINQGLPSVARPAHL